MDDSNKKDGFDTFVRWAIFTLAASAVVTLYLMCSVVLFCRH